MTTSKTVWFAGKCLPEQRRARLWPRPVRLGERLAAFPDAHVLDLGCGAGHASFTAAEQVAQVTAYDLSSQMLDVVAEAAKAKGLNNVTTRQATLNHYPLRMHRLRL